MRYVIFAGQTGCGVHPKFLVHANHPTSSSYDHALELTTDAFDSTTAYRFDLTTVETFAVRPGSCINGADTKASTAAFPVR